MKIWYDCMTNFRGLGATFGADDNKGPEEKYSMETCDGDWLIQIQRKTQVEDVKDSKDKGFNQICHDK